MQRPDSATAAIIVIGNEILSGKTQDANIQYLGRQLAKRGIVLEEARVIRDDTEMIVRHVNECRLAHTYVFTTGGIGPTHDDITADAIAKAFGRELVLNADAVERIGGSGVELNEARLKMARIPAGASLIDNTVSRAPGFRIGNVFVLAGIPKIAQAMFAALAPKLSQGKEIFSASVDVMLRESDIAEPLERIALSHTDVEIGSYPFTRDGAYGANLVARGTDRGHVNAVIAEIVAAMRAVGGATVVGDPEDAEPSARTPRQ